MGKVTALRGPMRLNSRSPWERSRAHDGRIGRVGNGNEEVLSWILREHPDYKASPKPTVDVDYTWRRGRLAPKRLRGLTSSEGSARLCYRTLFTVAFVFC